MKKESTKRNIRWLLVGYDILLELGSACFFLLAFEHLDLSSLCIQIGTTLLLMLVCRFAWDIYRQVWRFGGIQCYLRLMFADMCLYVCNYLLEKILPCRHISFVTLFAYISMGLLLSLLIRMIYRYLFKFDTLRRRRGKFVRLFLRFFSGNTAFADQEPGVPPRNIAIIGAGRSGVAFANDLLTNTVSGYRPRLFIDTNQEKIGRSIFDLPILDEKDITVALLRDYDIQEFVLSVPHLSENEKREFYEKYRSFGLNIKIYDTPGAQSLGEKPRVRDFDIEELLFRKPIVVIDETVQSYYTGKTVLITGGGGSIGSELCRQIAKMSPQKLIILDSAENGAYDIQQDLRIQYGNTLDLSVEILSVCNYPAMQQVFEKYHPQVVLHAAAHKHVPLMESNPIEAIRNNIFGTLNVVRLSDEFHVEHFIMISTDKAVNPTNVMGATKRFCELIVQAYSKQSKTVFSATRFGNVLGSAGSVVPLFKRQIANGGPVTVTDKRIIRYFMTIPEATQLVLASGSMAHNGELFVLNMGKPVKIWELAESMITLSSYRPYQDINIVETGLRPGEKLYEELLIQSENLRKTSNDLIFIETDTPIDMDELNKRLEILENATVGEDQKAAYEALRQTVPTFRKPSEINDAVQN